MNEVPIPGDPPNDCTDVIVHPTLGRDSVQFQKIVKYVEGLKAGLPPNQAAKDAGSSVRAFKLQGRAVQKYLAKARSEYTATAEELREMTVLSWVERALRDPGDPLYDPRESMAALHEISLIPEVGLKGQKSGGAIAARSFSDEEQAILDRVDTTDA